MSVFVCPLRLDPLIIIDSIGNFMYLYLAKKVAIVETRGDVERPPRPNCRSILEAIPMRITPMVAPLSKEH